MFEIEIVGEDQETLNILPEELDTICRLCLNKNGSVLLFERKRKKKVVGKFNKLLSYLSLLQVEEDDGMPQKICNTCTTLINEFYYFKEQVNASQVILKIALGKVNIQKEITNVNIEKENVKIDNTEKSDGICKEEIEMISDINEIKVEHSDIESDTIENCDYVNDYVDNFVEVKPIIQEITEEISIKTEQNVKEVPGYTCITCGETFIERKEFLSHRRKERYIKRRMNSNLRRVSCPVCKKMVVKDRMEDHMNVHTKTKPHVCEICGKSFASKPNLYTHKVIHREVKPHVCEICGRGFTQMPSLKDHMRCHNNEKLICHICGYDTLTMSAFRCHQRKHLKNKDYGINAPKIGISRRNQYPKKKVCDICNKQFLTYQRLAVHMYVHKGEKPYKCTLCDSRFVQVGQLNCHMRIHTGEKRYECSYCGKKFTINGNLQQHIKIHTGEKPFSCGVCQKSFVTNSSLTKHKRVHDKIWSVTTDK